MRKRWLAAQSAKDGKAKVELLRPFLILPHDDLHSAYRVWSLSRIILDEVDKAGPAAIPFLENLLQLPYYQENYAPETWTGFGAQQRVLLQQHLAIQRAKVSSSPESKLAELYPLFIPPKVQTSAGVNPDILVRDVIDKALTEVETVPTPQAIPFLNKLLELPYYKDDYRAPLGHCVREKIETALRRIQDGRGSNK